MKIHANSNAVKSHFCDKCPKSFVSNIELLRHQKTHEKSSNESSGQNSNTQSPQIIKTFHRTDYNNHPQNQQQSIPVQMPPSTQHQNNCIKCNIVFNKYEDLNAHMIIVHNVHHLQQPPNSHSHVVMPVSEYSKPFTGLGFYSEQKDFK